VVMMYTAGKPKVDYLDPTSEWAKLHAGLMKAFAGQMVEFAGMTKDEKTVLLFVYSDRNPGTYYLFDRNTNTPKLLFETMSWIEPAKMAPMMPVEFKNRTGESIHGFFTAPLGRKGPHPLVVMPHGGPFGISDMWGYDSHVQYLASKGYAVLQVNYRGSGYRGDSFETMAYRQWGTGIQDDIADGVKHVIAQGLANPAKVCIYGISFGGYSAMMNPIRNPGMYKCAIGYAGVYDLVKLEGDEDGSKQGRAWFKREVGSGEELVAQSPTAQVAKLDVPMLLIHGRSDQTAPFAQFNAAQAALSHAGKPFETLVKPSEGHGFYKEENRVEAFERIGAFLAKHNPVD
jgi:dipeptidyl aminopeptidase/acylaminoacyl peptidase